MGEKKEETETNLYTISVHDFENEFSRRYRTAINPNNFGFESVKDLLHSIGSQLPFKVIVVAHQTNIGFIPQQQQTNNNNTNNFYRNYNNNNYPQSLNININATKSVSNHSNITSPQFINSPSNYSNHSYSKNSQSNNSYTPYTNNQQQQILNNQQLLQQQQRYQLQTATTTNPLPYVIGTNSVGNYSIIPSVPNSLIPSVPNSLNALNLNTINLSLNMNNLQTVNHHKLQQQNTTNSNTAK